MKISVIIPSYRPQSYLYECLMSLERQRFDKQCFEVIIVLNGCCEPYRSEIVGWLSHMSLNAYVLQTEVAGVSNARNIGLDHAQGDFITFIDDDDLVSETYLSAMYALAMQGYIPLSNLIAFENDDLEQVVPNYISEVFCAHNQDGVIDNIVVVRSFFSTSVCKLLAKDIVGERRFDVHLTHGEDCVFMFAISDKCHSFQFTPHDAVYFRRIRAHSANTVAYSWSRSEKMRNAFRCIWRYSKSYFTAMGAYNFMFYVTRVAGALRSIVK